ncbi:hypothetical protein [Agromyces humi]|uniref:hypothetical protein n=1 Tax=Agromyces humi TaxID=1766800 RepID=UPI001358E482|nr:hypothetical protein [Agromyces humi]
MSAPVYAYCETITAGPTTRNHIRPITEAGLKTGGGADTVAICGREVAWDLRTADIYHLPGVTAEGVDWICANCRAEAERIAAATPKPAPKATLLERITGRARS